MSEAQRYQKTAELMVYDLRAKEALALRYAEKAAMAGDSEGAKAYRATAEGVKDVATGIQSKITSNMGAGQFKSIFGEIGSKFPVGEAIDIYEIGQAVDRSDWNDLGKKSTELLYSTLGG